MDKKLLSILACPICKGQLYNNKDSQELFCYADKLAFPVRDDIPIMLEEQARALSTQEYEARKDKNNTEEKAP